MQRSAPVDAGLGENVADTRENDIETTGVHEILSEIREKLKNARALNGGFDSLMVKVNNIETGQKKIEESVLDIHDAIYRPDDGVFARIQREEHERNRLQLLTEKRFDELTDWKSDKNESDEKATTKAETQSERIETISDEVQEISKWKKTITSIAVWMIGGMATGGAGMLAKILYTLFTHHTL